jgi:hypothetical protein
MTTYKVLFKATINPGDAPASLGEAIAADQVWTLLDGEFEAVNKLTAEKAAFKANGTLAGQYSAVSGKWDPAQLELDSEPRIKVGK